MGSTNQAGPTNDTGADALESRDERRVLLERMLLSQAFRELGAVELFTSALPLAPDDRWRQRLQHQAAEEADHLASVLAVWSALTGVATETLRARARDRLTQQPLPRPATFVELALAQHLYDRAGYFQLREGSDSAHEPYRRMVRAILAEEEQHQDNGAAALIALCTRPEDGDARAVAQTALPAWLRVALLSFGRPGSPASHRAVVLGLKRRDPAPVMRDFIADVRPVLASCGLRLPTADTLNLDLPNDLLL